VIGVFPPSLLTNAECESEQTTQERSLGSKVQEMFCLHVALLRVPMKQFSTALSNCWSKLLKWSGLTLNLVPTLSTEMSKTSLQTLPLLATLH
jgi:hypothetical protein